MNCNKLSNIITTCYLGFLITIGFFILSYGVLDKVLQNILYFVFSIVIVIGSFVVCRSDTFFKMVSIIIIFIFELLTGCGVIHPTFFPGLISLYKWTKV